MNYTPDPPRKWKRKEYDLKKLEGLSVRQVAELETDRDLDKSIEQLVCDVHEETHHPGRNEQANIAAAQKRMVSLMARVAKSNDRLAKWMFWLTMAIGAMTLVILVFELIHNFNK